MADNHDPLQIYFDFSLIEGTRDGFHIHGPLASKDFSIPQSEALFGVIKCCLTAIMLNDCECDGCEALRKAAKLILPMMTPVGASLDLDMNLALTADTETMGRA